MMTNNQLTLADAMAIAVLKKDMVSAYALADRLQEERDADPVQQAMEQAKTREGGRPDGHVVCQWPEFMAFAKRLGLMHDLLTMELVITIKVDVPVTIEQRYIGTDNLV